MQQTVFMLVSLTQFFKILQIPIKAAPVNFRHLPQPIDAGVDRLLVESLDLGQGTADNKNDRQVTVATMHRLFLLVVVEQTGSF